MIQALQHPSSILQEELLIYTNVKDAIPNTLDLPAFWESLKGRFPTLVKLASEAIQYMDASYLRIFFSSMMQSYIAQSN